jgi:hypothetical protein
MNPPKGVLLLLVTTFFITLSTINATTTTYYVGPTDDTTASDSNGYGTSRSQPFATVNYATQQLDGVGGTIILLDGEYHNDNYNDGNIWKNNQHTIRINNKHGTETNPIVIKGDSPDGHVLHGDADNIFQLRTSTYIILEDLNIEGEVNNISLDDAWTHRFDYMIQGDSEVYQREDPNASESDIEGKTYPDISQLNILRPSYYTTNGLLVQSCRYVIVRNCRVGYAPGTGLRIQSSDFVTVENNIVHNSSRRSSVGNHGMVIHSVTNNVGGVTINDNGYRIKIIGNTVHENYNEVYSWSSLKTFITPHIDEGKGITVQKTDSNFDNGSGRILIANNLVYGNGFSGVHTNFATKVDIYHNTAVENTASGKGVNVGISVSDSSDVNVINNVAYSTNDFNGNVYSTDIDNPVDENIIFASNVAVGNINQRLDENDFIIASVATLKMESSAPYRLFTGSLGENVGDSTVLSTVPLDKDGMTRSNPPDLGAFEIDLSLTLSPTTTPSPTTLELTPTPSTSVTSNGNCVDSPLSLLFNGRERNCEWAGRRIKRCKKSSIASHCPVTCDSCNVNQCTDSSISFNVEEIGKIKTCLWASKNPDVRCQNGGVEETCRRSCNTCIDTPVENPNCVDSPLEFKVNDNNRSCTWVGDNTSVRCELTNVKSHCPVLCNACDEHQCSDSDKKFVLQESGVIKSCEWVSKKVSKRCNRIGVEDTCRQTCETCG